MRPFQYFMVDSATEEAHPKVACGFFARKLSMKRIRTRFALIASALEAANDEREPTVEAASSAIGPRDLSRGSRRPVRRLERRPN
jgi:hypothetical protein